MPEPYGRPRGRGALHEVGAETHRPHDEGQGGAQVGVRPAHAPVAVAYSDVQAAYESWRVQRQVGEIGGMLDCWKFAPYVDADDTVLDFGCGGGYILAHLAAREKVGVEPNPFARAVAQANAIQTHERAADVTSGSVDVVISNHALGHTLAPYEELRDLLRALRPGGSLVIAVAFIDWRDWRQRGRSRGVPKDAGDAFYTWTPQLLANLLREAGFELQDVGMVARGWNLRLSPRLRWLPRPLFEFHTWLISTLLNRREVIAVARKPGVGV
jgi:SAM-dependent methyltransferase